MLTDFMMFHFRLMRREALDAAGGFDPVIPAEVWDYDLALRLSEVAQVRCLPLPLYQYRQHGSSLSATRRKEQLDAAAAAVRAAIRRRGVDDQIKLVVSPRGQFRLCELS